MIYIVGAGYMADEYSKVLNSLEVDFTVVGRSEKNVNILKQKYGCNSVSGGYEKLLRSKDLSNATIINCLPIELLANSTINLIDAGVKSILIEKPGALSTSDLICMSEKANKNNAEVRIGYNRRFYQSFLTLEKYLQEEPLVAVDFEITEWGHVISNETNPESVKQKWILANTSHVIDVVLYFTGELVKLETFSSGSLDWHASASNFVGAGISKSGVLISYGGFWEGPGRWSIDFVTNSRRFIFRPMEKLQIQQKGSIKTEFDESIDYTLDEDFKPGLYLQTKAFLDGDFSRLATIESQIKAFKSFSKIGNYEDI